METRMPNPEGKGGISMLDLVINSLRMRPDRIIMGEYVPKEAAIASKLIVFNGIGAEGISPGMELDISGQFCDWAVNGQPLYEISPGVWIAFLRVYEGSWEGVQVKTKGTWDLKWDLQGNPINMGGSTLKATINESKPAELIFFDGSSLSGVTNRARFTIKGLPGGTEALHRIDDKLWVGLVHADPGRYQVQVAGVGTSRVWSLEGQEGGRSTLTIQEPEGALPQLIVFNTEKASGFSPATELDVTGDFIDWRANGIPLQKINDQFHAGLIWADKDIWFLQVKTRGRFDQMWNLEGQPVEKEDGSKLWMKSVTR